MKRRTVTSESRWRLGAMGVEELLDRELEPYLGRFSNPSSGHKMLSDMIYGYPLSSLSFFVLPAEQLAVLRATARCLLQGGRRVLGAGDVMGSERSAEKWRTTVILRRELDAEIEAEVWMVPTKVIPISSHPTLLFYRYMLLSAICWGLEGCDAQG